MKSVVRNQPIGKIIDDVFNRVADHSQPLDIRSLVSNWYQIKVVPLAVELCGFVFLDR